MLIKIYRELLEIRKELQAALNSLEYKTYLYSLGDGDTNNLVEKDVQVIKTESVVT